MCILDKIEIWRFVHIIFIIIMLLFHRPRGYVEGYFEVKTSHAYLKGHCACP